MVSQESLVAVGSHCSRGYLLGGIHTVLEIAGQLKIDTHEKRPLSVNYSPKQSP